MEKHILSQFLQDPLSGADFSSAWVPLDIPIPDLETKEDEIETDKQEKKEAPSCGFLPERLLALLARVKPEVWTLKEKCVLVITWIQHLIHKIEDGNDFGVAIQEQVLERVNAIVTKVETSLTAIPKSFSGRGGAVTKASKETHVIDYWALVYEVSLWGAQSHSAGPEGMACYTQLYRISSSNLEKIISPEEEKKALYVLS